MTCVDFDVLLPAKLQDKVAPTIDPLLEDRQVSMLTAAAQQMHPGACKDSSYTLHRQSFVALK